MNKENETESDKDYKNFELLYSPRTNYAKELEREQELFNDLTLNFDPITIKIIKKHFKERLGSLKKIEFVTILKNHLLSWHPELPDREIHLVKLLGRLFSEIDLNDNGDLEWAEFTNYIIHNSNGINKQSNTNNPAYRLRFYYPTKIKLDTDDTKSQISLAYYIEKYNILAVVQDGKSQIYFYNCKNFEKLKSYIDLNEIQKEIDELEIKELDIRADENIKKEILEREEKIKKQKRMLKTFFNSTSKSSKSKMGYTIYNAKTNKHIKPIITTTTDNFYNATTNETSSNFNKTNTNANLNLNLNIKTPLNLTSNNFHKKRNNHIASTHLPNIHSKKRDEKTPEKLRQELERIKHEQFISPVNKKLTAVAIVFINEFDVLLISTTNNKICAWQYANNDFKNVNTNHDFRIEKNYFRCSILSSDSPQNTLSWDPILRNLYSGQSDGKILKWNLAKAKALEKEELDYEKAKIKKEEELKKNKGYDAEANLLEKRFTQQKRHASPIKIPGKDTSVLNERKKRNSVSCTLLLGKLQLLAASYYNGNIILWDTLLKEFRKFYFDQETGVYAMTYDSQKNYLITAGFNHDIYIYDPYIDNNSIYKLIGHNWSLNSIVSIEKESEIISLDILGNIKVWDSLNFLNFQTINLNETLEVKKNSDSLKNRKLSSNLKMLYISKIKKILVYGNKNIIFETDKAQNPNLADDQIILACFYEKITKSIISFCLRKIKMWNIFTGKLNQVYEDPMNNEITALAIDVNMKRAFLGDNTGHIKNLNMKNGKLLKELEPHSVEINMLVHSLALNIVVSCSIDNVIKIHDDSELTESEVKKELFIQNGQVKCIAICEKYARLAIGLSSGLIKFYDIEHFRYDSDLHSDDPNLKNSKYEIICLAPIQGTEILFYANVNGDCKFMVIPPSQMKFEEISSFSNLDPKENNSPSINDKKEYTNNPGVNEKKEYTNNPGPNDKKEYTNNPGTNDQIEYAETPVTCCDYDIERKLMFTGDQSGYIKCYDIKGIFDFCETDQIINKKYSKSFSIKDVQMHTDKIKVKLKWEKKAHNLAIKHIYHVDIEPRIVISTGNDLHVKIYSAETGDFKDELKQISCKYKPVPIGIKYTVNDPFKSKNEQNKEEFIIYRKQLEGHTKENLEDIENQQSKKIIYKYII